MENLELEINLKQYCELQFLATGMENPPSDLMSELFEAEDKICSHFSIPDNSINLLNLSNDILEYQKDSAKYLIDFHNRIKEYAEFFLLSTPLTNSEVLEKFNNQIYAALVCNELQVEFHIYTDFLYSELFCRDQIKEEDFLAEINIIKDNRNVLGLLGRLAYTNSKVETIELMDEIENFSLQYPFVFLAKFDNLKDS